MAKKKQILDVDGLKVSLINDGIAEYISLTDMAKSANPRTDIVIQNWLRNRNTIEFLGLWEQMYNANFNPIEFDGIRNQAGLNTFALSSKQWIERVGAIGIISKAGRYGGTFAHKDIAFEFGTWLSPAFKLYLIKDYQRLKEEEMGQQSLEWNVKRLMAKVNYQIHSEAVKEYLIPPAINSKHKEWMVYASEADLLNIALFGMTSKEWRLQNSEKKGNMRDEASTLQLLVLANLESLNAKLIEWGCDKEERLNILNKTAVDQMQTLLSNSSTKKLNDGEANIKKLK